MVEDDQVIVTMVASLVCTFERLTHATHVHSIAHSLLNGIKAVEILAEDGTGHNLAYRSNLVRFAPEAMHGNLQVGKYHLLAVVEESRSLEQSHDILPATVAHIYLAVNILAWLLHVLQFLANVRYRQEHLHRHIHLINLLLDRQVFFGRESLRNALVFRSRLRTLDHLIESRFAADRLRQHAHDETVEDSLKTLSLGRQFVARGNEKLQRQVHLLCAIKIGLLVDDGQERVLYCRTCLPYLVEEDHVGTWQIAISGTLIAIGFFQARDADRTEDLVGSGETRHQILKRTGIAEGMLQTTRHHALSHTRRAKQQDALSSQGSKERQAQFGILLEHPLLQFVQDTCDTTLHKHDRFKKLMTT